MIYLIAKYGVVLTDSILETISLLMPYFTEAKHYATITSGFRSPEAQLDLIKDYAQKHNIIKEYPDLLGCSLQDKDRDDNYAWQKAWSKLLKLGIIINPPLPAKVLFDYFKNGVNQKGKTISASPHIRGTDFDIGGGDDIQTKINIVNKAYREGKANIKYYVVEIKNNAIHIGGKNK